MEGCIVKIAIYARKSVQTKKGESIENQIKECKKYLSNNFTDFGDAEIHIYKDEGFSGKSIDRPEFKRMMEDIKHIDFDCVVCYRLDRISRSITDFSNLIEMLNNKGISFICTSERFDTSTPTGKAMMYIASVFAQLERETIAERVRDNLRMLARTGRWLGGTTPTGFDSEKVSDVMIEGKIKTYYKLIENEEMETIEIIFRKFFEFDSISGVHRYLALNKIYSRTGKEFSMRVLKEIYTNPVYCIADKEAREYFMKMNADVCFDESETSDFYGLSAYNKRDYSKKNAPRNPIDEWIISKGKHRGIVKGKDWIYIQQKIHENKTSHDKSGNRNNYSLLSGLVYCKSCGAKMFTKMKTNGDLFYYVCSRKMRGGKELCDLPNLSGQQADDLICSYLLEKINISEGVFKHLDKLKENLTDDNNSIKVNKLKKEISKRKKDISYYVDNLLNLKLNDVLINEINKKVETLNLEIEEREKELEEITKNVTSIENYKFQVDVILNSLKYFKENFHNLTLQDKRAIIRLLVEKCVWDGETLDIFLYGE